MSKLYSFHGEKKSKKAATAKCKKKTAGKRDRSKMKSPDDEAAIKVLSVRSKLSEEIPKEAQPDVEKVAAKESKRAKSSVDVEMAGAPTASAEPVEKKVNRAATEKKKTDGKRVEKAKALDDEKVGGLPGEEKKSDDEKAGAKRAEEKRPVAEKAKKKQASDDEKAGRTKTEQKKPTAEKAKKAQETDSKVGGTRMEQKKLAAEKKRVVDTPAPPSKPAKRRTGGVQRKPAAKKARTVNSIAALVNSSDPQTFVRRRVAKDFDGETYFGTVMEYDDAETPAYWHVEYDDGDEEDYSKKDLIKALKYHEVHGKKDRQS